MPRHTALTILCAAALLLAGCVGADDEPLRAATDEPQPNEGAAGAASAETGNGDGGGSSSSGGSGGEPPADEEPEEPPADEASPTEPVEASEPGPQVVPISFNGTLGTGVWTCRAVDGGHECHGTGSSSADAQHEPAFNGSVLTYRVEARWEAQTPLTESLRLTLSLCDTSTCHRFTTEGPSPLTLQGSVAGDAGSPRLSIGPVPHALPEGSQLFLERDQPFTLTGELVGRTRAPGAGHHAEHAPADG